MDVIVSKMCDINDSTGCGGVMKIRPPTPIPKHTNNEPDLFHYRFTSMNKLCTDLIKEKYGDLDHYITSRHYYDVLYKDELSYPGYTCWSKQRITGIFIYDNNNLIVSIPFQNYNNRLFYTQCKKKIFCNRFLRPGETIPQPINIIIKPLLDILFPRQNQKQYLNALYKYESYMNFINYINSLLQFKR